MAKEKKESIIKEQDDYKKKVSIFLKTLISLFVILRLFYGLKDILYFNSITDLTSKIIGGTIVISACGVLFYFALYWLLKDANWLGKINKLWFKLLGSIALSIYSIYLVGINLLGVIISIEIFIIGLIYSFLGLTIFTRKDKEDLPVWFKIIAFIIFAIAGSIFVWFIIGIVITIFTDYLIY